MSTFNDTVQVVANASELSATANAFFEPDCGLPAIIESALPEAMTIWMIIEVVVVTAVLAMSELYLAIVKSVFLAGVSALEMVFLGIVLLALHYWILPSHFDFIHKPNRIMPGIKRQPLHPRDILFDCKLIMLAVDLANVGLNLTEFCLMLPILMAFLAMHLLVGVILWCSLPAPLRPVRLVLRLCQLAPNRASATGSKALLEKSLVIVPRGSRSIQFWVRNQGKRFRAVRNR